MNKSEQEFQAQELKLAQDHGASLVDRVLAPLRKKFADIKPLKAYFQDFREDVLDNLSHYQGRQERDPRTSPEQAEQISDSFFQRYEANLFVDNFGANGVPVIREINLGFFNLQIGRAHV